MTHQLYWTPLYRILIPTFLTKFCHYYFVEDKWTMQNRPKYDFININHYPSILLKIYLFSKKQIFLFLYDYFKIQKYSQNILFYRPPPCIKKITKLHYYFKQKVQKCSASPPPLFSQCLNFLKYFLRVPLTGLLIDLGQLLLAQVVLGTEITLTI